LLRILELNEKFQQNIFQETVSRGRIEQALINLFINAWQAMPTMVEILI
jgi:hypothetical protein